MNDLVARAQRDSNCSAAFVQQFAAKQCSPESWMHATRSVEQAAVAALDETRYDVRAACCGQSLVRGFPRRIDERSINPGMADFAARKDNERSTVAKPEMRPAQSGAASGRCLGSVRRVDEETGIVHLWNAFKQPVGEYAHVRPYSPYDVEKEKAIQCTMRVSGDDDERSSRWNRRQIRIGDTRTDVERFEDSALKRVGGIGWIQLNATVQAPQGSHSERGLDGPPQLAGNGINAEWIRDYHRSPRLRCRRWLRGCGGPRELVAKQR
jgi:hypothetical protein